MKTKNNKNQPHPSESVIIQFGVAFIVVAGVALLSYVMQRFVP